MWGPYVGTGAGEGFSGAGKDLVAGGKFSGADSGRKTKISGAISVFRKENRKEHPGKI